MALVLASTRAQGLPIMVAKDRTMDLLNMGSGTPQLLTRNQPRSEWTCERMPFIQNESDSRYRLPGGSLTLDLRL